MTKRVALITGASRGIGAAVAKRFAAEGMQVILVARSSENLQIVDDEIRAAGGLPAILVPLDLLESDKIPSLAEQVAQRFGRLDVLVGNAAILGEIAPIPHANPADWEKTMALNVGANWHLLRCFDPLLLASGAGRAMFVTSGVTRRAAAYWGAYAVSKTALEMMVNIYAAETAKTNLRINLIDPGVVRTRMRAQAFPGEDPETLTLPEKITDVFVKLASPTLTETGQKFYAPR
ncbi:MAG: SDR family NAD(P)-dependent oxidoreductase [Alphaproteobacteria bacterium]|nr:SDR family NAD(P)-dependent oxidoreductase [Alphaproteobacteria bacterium]